MNEYQVELTVVCRMTYVVKAETEASARVIARREASLVYPDRLDIIEIQKSDAAYLGRQSPEGERS